VAVRVRAKAGDEWRRKAPRTEQRPPPWQCSWTAMSVMSCKALALSSACCAVWSVGLIDVFRVHTAV